MLKKIALFLCLIATGVLFYVCIKHHAPGIQNRIQMQFANQLRASDLPISIEGSVDGRDITLTGTVDDESLKDRADDLARNVTGVRAVNNMITVRPIQRPAVIVDNIADEPMPATQDISESDRIADTLVPTDTGIEDVLAVEIVPSAPDDDLQILTAASRDDCQANIQDYLTRNTILFKPSSDTLETESINIINGLNDILKQCPQSLVVVEGHSDLSGDSYKNLLLSAERAAGVAEYMRENTDMSVKHVGYGDQRPIAPNDTAAGRMKNRRIVIKLEPLDADRYVPPEQDLVPLEKAPENELPPVLTPLEPSESTLTVPAPQE